MIIVTVYTNEDIYLTPNDWNVYKIFTSKDEAIKAAWKYALENKNYLVIIIESNVETNTHRRYEIGASTYYYKEQLLDNEYISTFLVNLELKDKVREILLSQYTIIEDGSELCHRRVRNY